jgi:hypothetical protein
MFFGFFLENYQKNKSSSCAIYAGNMTKYFHLEWKSPKFLRKTSSFGWELSDFRRENMVPLSLEKFLATIGTFHLPGRKFTVA